MTKSLNAMAAKARFKRRILYLVVAGAAMVVVAIFYLASYGPLTVTLVLTVTVGVFVSVVLGGGLMAVGFFSASSGIDDEVSSAGIVPSEASKTEAEVSPLKPSSEERMHDENIRP